MFLKKIITEKTLCHSKAFAFTLQEFSKLLALDHAELEIPFTNQSQVTYGLDDNGKVIASSVHAYEPTRRVLWIQFSAVAEEHRQQGAYRELFAEVRKLAKLAGATNIYAGISTENAVMLDVAKKLNRLPVVVRYRYPLTD